MAIVTKIETVQSAYSRRLRLRQGSDIEPIWNLLDSVTDPEIPVLSLWDLGVLTNIELVNNRIIVTITPTYSGCPAIEVMRQDIARVLADAGYTNAVINSSLSPAWTTDWLSPQGRQKLLDYGIAPPQSSKCCDLARGTTPQAGIECPQCDSHHTVLISEFGSTACKALFQCQKCQEVFDYFKVL